MPAGVRIVGHGDARADRERDDTMQTDTMQPAKSSGTFKIGGDLPVVRLGYGAMRITGPGIWGPP
ncbi:MAG: pyridoxine 4-dehydrogenase [Actinomycetota bacterium]|nr:pyridoxine 4-dehydrogenase [Actinomycetota bacterium]